MYIHTVHKQTEKVTLTRYDALVPAVRYILPMRKRTTSMNLYNHNIYTQTVEVFDTFRSEFF